MKRLKASEEAISGVNVIPIIDVTLVLLVILLVMSPIVNLPSLPVDLPEAMTKETKDQNISVTLTAEGFIAVDNDKVEFKDLPAKLRRVLETREDIVVIVRADKNLPYGVVDKLLKVVNRNAGKFPVAVGTRQRSRPLETAGAETGAKP